MLDRFTKGVMQFSGGKDSLAALYMCRPWLDKIEVHFADTGAHFPHVAGFVERTCEKLGANLKVLRPDMPIEDFHKERGLPSDIVPEWLTPAMGRMMEKPPEIFVQSALNCCMNMIWAPLVQGVLDSEAGVVIRGTKADDERLGVREKSFKDINGVEYISPIWDMSDDDVFAYLKAEGAEIPPQYPSMMEGGDCWICTGHLRTDYAEDRMKYIVKNLPEFMPELQRRASMLQELLHSEQAKVDHILDMVNHA